MMRKAMAVTVANDAFLAVLEVFAKAAAAAPGGEIQE